MGTDGAGIVLAVGSEVRHVKVGDRVAGMVYGASSRTNGTAAEGKVTNDVYSTWVECWI
jgi:NADPH:quinone reductase-like Zn-dependent oxidoreductase